MSIPVAYLGVILIRPTRTSPARDWLQARVADEDADVREIAMESLQAIAD